jgi:acetyl esterase/lipase
VILSLPTRPAKALLVAFPGGGFVRYDTSGLLYTLAPTFNAAGIAYAIGTYRPATGSTVLLANQVDDACVSVANAAAKYPGVPVFLLGASAGGVIAALAADRLRASGLIAWCAPSDLSLKQSGVGDSTKAKLLGVQKPTTDQLRAVSPAWMCLGVRTLIQHNREKNAAGIVSDDAGSVPASQARTWDANLRAKGTDSTLRIYDGLAHVWAGAGKATVEGIVSEAVGWIGARV